MRLTIIKFLLPRQNFKIYWRFHKTLNRSLKSQL